jgi:hypothetical protein
MQWSARPEVTGCTCAVEGDGTNTRSSTAFTSPSGEEVGRQTITAETDTPVHHRLRNRGTGGRVRELEVDLQTEPLGFVRTRVRLDLRLRPSVPALLQPVGRFFPGRKSWPLHREALGRLERPLKEALA